MSAEAVLKMRQLWGKLIFARVNRVIAREPEDVLSIEVSKILTTKDGFMLPSGPEYIIRSNRTKDIPDKDRWRASIAWRHYYGFTDTGVYFQSDDCLKIDYDIGLTFDFGPPRVLNHITGKFTKPENGSLICGEIKKTQKGRRFARWFHCDPAFKYLYDIVMKGATLSEKEIAPKLLTDDHPDVFFAVARLVIFDNVQAFVDLLKEYKERPPHPAEGVSYGRFYGAKQHVINYRGMMLRRTGGAAEYVHEISHNLREQRWWEEFKRLAIEQGLDYSHPPYGGWCNACEAERNKCKLH